MRKRNLPFVFVLFLIYIFCLSPSVSASQASPLLTYKGANGVEIRSYVPGYDETKLQWFYKEFTKNTMGEEVSYLSYINLYPDYPRGDSTAGVWHGEWLNNKLTPGRSIDLYGVSDNNPHVLTTLSHEYGHHFMYYYLNKKEGMTNNFLNSEYSKVRNLNLYEELNNGSHAWSAAEIAAEDYVQLFGNPSLSQSRTYQFYPQENTEIPLAWDVPGLYDYFVKLSGLQGKSDYQAPSKPTLRLTQVTDNEILFHWDAVTDNSNKPLIYSIVGITNGSENNQTIYVMNSTQEANRYTSSLNRRQLSRENVNTILVKLVVMDQSGNAVSSEVPVDLSDPEASLSYLFPGVRLAGADRYQTSVAVSQAGFPNGSSYAILVTGENFPDALAAAPLAKKYNAPILLTPSKALNPHIEAEISRLGVKNVLIIGGKGAVSLEIETSLKAKGIGTKRIEGASRYDTALAIAKEVGAFNEVFICTGENFPDALSAAAVAASQGIPILLTPAQDLPEGFLKFLEDREVTRTYVVGGTGVVSPHVYNQLPKAKRLSGNNRYETNQAILQEFSTSLTGHTAYLATGNNYPDALSGSILAAQKSSPILLVGSSGLTEADNYLESKSLSDREVQVIGGPGVVSDLLLKELFR